MLSCKFKFFFIVFRVAKVYHQDFNLLHIIILVIHHLFLVKNGSPLMCFYVHNHEFTCICVLNNLLLTYNYDYNINNHFEKDDT
jgi:hypothetical protein